MNNKTIVKVLVVALALTLADLIIPFIPFSKIELDHIGRSLFANLLVSLVLCVYTLNTRLKKSKLFFALLIISFGIGSLNILIEAWIFNITDRNQTLLQLLFGLLHFAFMSFALTYAFRNQETQNETIEFSPRTKINWSWRIIAGMLLYIFLYLLAGIILQVSLPQLSEFYEGKLPAISLMINTQWLRGLIFIGIGMLFLRTCTLSKYNKAIILGLIFSVLGGIAPLIPHNELMPPIIRLGHGIEVGISNFIYGWLLGLLLNTKQAQGVVSENPG